MTGQRLHPITILLQGGPRGFGLAFAGATIASVAAGAADMAWFGAARIPLALVGLAIGFGYELARYRRFEYELAGDTLDIHSGVFARREREIPIDRIQNLDVTRDVPARLLGVAIVEIETAGGGETEATFQYLSLADARTLQEWVRRRKREASSERAGRAERAGATEGDPSSELGTPSERAGTDEPSGDVPDGKRAEPVTGDAEPTGQGDRETLTPDAGDRAVPKERERTLAGEGDRQRTLFELDTTSLLVLSALSYDLRALSLLLFGGPVAWPFLERVLDAIARGPAGVALALAAAGVIVLAGALWLVGAATTFARFYGFRLARVGDELRYERGLIQRYDGSVPLGKIQAMTVEENALMRGFGYAALSIETAGYAPGASPSGGSEAAVPLAPRERVLELASRIDRFEEPSLERPPARARRRLAIRYGLVVAVLVGAALAVNALLVSIPWYLLGGLFVLVPLAARATWRNRGRGLGERHVFTRNGFWNRRTHVVPYRRIQTLLVRRTVFQRRWGLASVVVDTAGSRSLTGRDARAVDYDREDAGAFAGTLLERFGAAIGSRPTARDGRTGPPDDGGDAGPNDASAEDLQTDDRAEDDRKRDERKQDDRKQDDRKQVDRKRDDRPGDEPPDCEPPGGERKREDRSGEDSRSDRADGSARNGDDSDGEESDDHESGGEEPNGD